MASGIRNKKQSDKNKNKRKASIIMRMKDGKSGDFDRYTINTHLINFERYPDKNINLHLLADPTRL